MDVYMMILLQHEPISCQRSNDKSNESTKSSQSAYNYTHGFTDNSTHCLNSESHATIEFRTEFPDSSFCQFAK